MTIAILVPTRARPQLFKRMVDSALSTASDPNNLRFYVAIRDEDREIYTHDILKHACHKHIMPDGMPTSHKWNCLSEYAIRDNCKLFMLAADDIVFTTPCWDKALLEVYDGKPHVYSLLDSRDASGTPHPIVNREYIEAMGYFLPPIFLHWYVDTWTVEIAKANNCFTHLKDYMLIHDKGWDKNKPDDTHNFLHKAAWLNCDQYTNKHCQHLLQTEKQRLKCALG